MSGSLQPRVDRQTAEANMAEKEPRYSAQEARVEADRCLYCFDAPCIMACPTGIDVPGFIKKISHDNLTGAARTILQANILGASCGRVCPTEVLCEGACVLQDRDNQPIKIGRLQRYSTDAIQERNIKVVSAAAKKSGKRVALIGGGPASLACAAELVQLGHGAVIFEKKDWAGGLNTYGIAYYKMTPQASLEEIDMILNLGVEIRENCTVGEDVSATELQREFDAIFVGVGLGHTHRLGIPGEDLPEVLEAITFIEQIHARELDGIPVGRRVAVIGCGNTAIDAVTQSKRLGAESAIIVYRRSEAEMSAYGFEYKFAKDDQCDFLFNVAPQEILGDGHVTGLKLMRTKPREDGSLETIPGSEFEQPFDMVIKALGQEKMVDLVKGLLPELQFDTGGRIRCNGQTGETNLPGVYAGGDAANGGAEVVHAVAEGKKAAQHMHQVFTGETVEPLTQTTRLGVPGKPSGSGFDQPVCVPQLEAEYYASRGH